MDSSSPMSATPGGPRDPANAIYGPAVLHNSPIASTKFLSACFAGAVAGVLGLTNASGFALFALAMLLTSACLYLKCRGRPGKYVQGGWTALVSPGQVLRVLLYQCHSSVIMPGAFSHMVLHFPRCA